MEEREVIDRNQIQEEIIESCVTSLNLTGSAAIIASVGIGKSKIVLEVLNKLNPDKITWVTSSEELRDVDSPNEFYKWGYEHLLDKTTFVCYQTAYKWVGEDMGFVVYDEGDVLATEEYVKAHTNNKQDKTLLVTGTTTDEKREVFKRLEIPIVYEISNQDAQDMGVLNKTNFVFVEYDLSMNKTLEKTTKAGAKYKVSENEEYQKIESNYMKLLIPFLQIQKTISDYYDRGIPFPEGETYSSLKEKKNKIVKSMNWINAQRYRFLQGLDTNIIIAKKLLAKHYYGNEKDKMVVFAGLTAQVERICKYTYHSKNKKGSTVLEDFNNDMLRAFGACSALDRGKNMKGLNIGIWADLNSSHTKVGQQIGENLPKHV